MDTQSDAARLKAIRARLYRVPDRPWHYAVEGREACVVRPDLMGAAEAERIVTFAAGATMDEQMLVADACMDLRFLVGLVDRALAKIRTLSPAPPKPKDHAAEAAMLCDRVDFQRFLAGLVPENADTPAAGVAIPAKEKAAMRLRSVLAIGSRRDLNTDPAAAERWRRLKSDFWDRRKRGRR